MSQPRLKLGLGLTLLVAGIAVAVGVGIYLSNRRERPAGEGLIVDPPQAKVPDLPRPGTMAYRETVGAFYGGVAALEVNAPETNIMARQKLTRATEFAPGEPAAWADLALLEIRTNDPDGAARHLERARELAPDVAAIEALLGLLASRKGDSAGAIAHLKRAVALAPDDLRSRWALKEEVDKEAGPDADAEMDRLVREILERRPDNLPALLERTRLAVKRGDAKTLAELFGSLDRFAPDWAAKTRDDYASLKASASNTNLAVLQATRLKNVLVRSSPYQNGQAALIPPSGTIGVPIYDFLKMTPPRPTPAAPDSGLAFAVEAVAATGAEKWAAARAASMAGAGAPTLFVADRSALRKADGAGIALPFPGGAADPSHHGILPVDLNSDFRVDLVLAGGGGIRILRQKEDGNFEDVTAAAKLDAALLARPAFGAWAMDVEMEGDLDVVLAATEGPAVVLRNNRDGTFQPITPFEGAVDVRDFAWADFDRDGDPDAATLDAKGAVRLYSNERGGVFRIRPTPSGLDGSVALTVADLEGDGRLDLLALGRDGSVRRASAKEEMRGWDVVEAAKGEPVGEGARLIAADLDNNGAPDLVASGSARGWIALGDDSGRFQTIAWPVGLRVASVADLDGDGTLDLAGLDAQGRPARGKGKGPKGYRWAVLRPRATRVEGDGRINSFGVGGEIQVRAGLLVQTQPIDGPAVHFGLGDYAKTDAARIVWPNGANQGEFDLKTNTEVVAEQKLKGSCPFLYAFDGESVKFVTDAIWRSPLGLRINAQDTAGAGQTEDWVKVRGDQLAAKDGTYDLRVTAELWETHYWDHFSLMVVDHPKGTEVFVDERFAREPPRLAVHATGPLVSFTYARDDRGEDVASVVRDRDEDYLDTFGRGSFQGVTRDHWVEVEVGDEVARDRPLVLVAQGWIHPTDSSINVALAQGSHDRPKGLSLEVATAEGGWSVARPDLGFPAGKNKTILVPLDGVFPKGAPRRLRLRTNLEIYWDRLAVAEARPDVSLKTTRLAAASAELRHRGFSAMTQAGPGSPELPDYGTLDGAGQRWRDLIGYYTRFGDVRELVKGVDDRYAIVNAGDELALTFDAPPGPEDGMVRDFVFIGDGWNKDGDYNTAFSKTVLPLPSHASPAYDAAPGELEDDPVYRAHAKDWEVFHTRYVTADAFARGLASDPSLSPARGEVVGRAALGSTSDTTNRARPGPEVHP